MSECPVFKPAVMRQKALGMQLCVPRDWNDSEIESFANESVVCGTEHGWKVDPEQGRCSCDTHREAVHVVVVA